MNHRHWMLAIVIGWFCPLLGQAGEPLTFFAWSDQHITPAGKADHLIPAVEAMNGLEGTEYPADIGGKVGKPAFVFGCGDMSEWPSAAARDAYNDVITKRLKIPAFDIIGNHDEGGNVPRPTMKDWIIARHKALRYSFDQGGVHFLAVYSEYDERLNNPAQAISKAALEFIQEDLARTPKGRPVIVALHLCFDAITNRDELVQAFGGANVILVLGGHYHKPTVDEYRGFRFVQAPSPQSTTEFTVIRVEKERLVAIPYDYRAKKWDDNRRVRLDVPIRSEGSADPPGGDSRGAGDRHRASAGRRIPGFHAGAGQEAVAGRLCSESRGWRGGGGDRGAGGEGGSPAGAG